MHRIDNQNKQITAKLANFKMIFKIYIQAEIENFGFGLTLFFLYIIFILIFRSCAKLKPFVLFI